MKVTKELLYKFKEGYCSLEEKEAIEAWLNDGTWPELDGGEPVPDEVKHIIWEKLNRRIVLPKERQQRRSYLPRAAAIALILLGSGTLLFYYLKNKRSYREAVYITAQNERKRVVLSDSSVIFLSPGSSIKVQQPFPERKRDIVLSGEAFFEVAKDPLRPFTVITNNIRTTALGTSFRVTFFPERNKVNVVLSYGRIVVCDQSESLKTDSLYLIPGEMVVYDSESHHLEKQKTNRRQFDYRYDVLYFKNAGVREVVEKLERYYNVVVRYNSLKDLHWQVSGEFDYQPLDVVMRTIAYSCHIAYSVNRDTLVLKPDTN